MTVDALVDSVGIYAGAFAVGAISSVIPVVCIEVFLVAVTLAHGPSAVVVALATVGQVLGKVPVYWSTRGAASVIGERWVARARCWMSRFGDRPALLVLTSAVLGVPPFSLISTAAGVLAVRPRTFFVAVAVGRALRFAVLVALASS